jgi:hypothetical protein
MYAAKAAGKNRLQAFSSPAGLVVVAPTRA